MKTYSVQISQPMERLGCIEVEELIEAGGYEGDVLWDQMDYVDSAEVLGAEEAE